MLYIVDKNLKKLVQAIFTLRSIVLKNKLTEIVEIQSLVIYL